MRKRWLLLVVLLVLMTGCGSPNPAELLGPDAKLLARNKVGDAVVMLGELPSGEWVTAVSAPKSQPLTQTVLPQQEPMPFLAGDVAVLTGKAPPEAVRYELLTREGTLLKGKITNGVYLIAWYAGSENPGYILRILNEKDDEIYRWPPAGGLPAA